MAYLFGALLDVSGSMTAIPGGGIDKEGGEWAKSIFQVIDDLIKYDLNPQNEVFALAVGASRGNGVFDILSTIKTIQTNMKRKTSQFRRIESIVFDIFGLLEQNGATHIRKWATERTVCNVLDADLAPLLLRAMQKSSGLCRSIVNTCLPPACKDWNVAKADSTGIINGIQGMFASAVSSIRQATEGEVRDALEKAERLLKPEDLESEVKLIEKGHRFTFKKAKEIVHGVTEESIITNERARQLLEIIKPFIYGLTPLYQSLQNALDIFAMRLTPYNQVLVVLSDGEPSDTGNILQVSQEFKDKRITVVGCFITESKDIETKRLYSSNQQGWGKGAFFLFQLSSVFSIYNIPSIMKRNWKIDIEDNEIKLFLQVNHPDNINEVCKLARDAVCCQDSLSELLGSTSLDIYINEEISEFSAGDQQQQKTCYAYASAATIHLATKRILGRDGGYPDFKTLLHEIIELYGVEGAHVLPVLQAFCPKYRLQCKKIDNIDEALQAITEKRPLVAIFWLTDREWITFKDFFSRNGSGILTRNELDISLRTKQETLEGHAVVLTGFDSNGLILMNSWGTDWCESGFFRVENANILNFDFIDVFWNECDLSSSEKEFYDRHGADVAKQLIRRLKGLHSAMYTCPKCKESSNVTKFTGTISDAICPKCNDTFKGNEEGNILALNLYLTSISH